jgi:hypothetical protein
VATPSFPDSSELSELARYSTHAECDSDSDDGDVEVITSGEASSTTSLEEDIPRYPNHRETLLPQRLRFEPQRSTPPVSRKRRFHLLSGFLKSRNNCTVSVPTPTYAAAPQPSLPLHFLNHPGNPGKRHRRESHIARKLFRHKGKERSIDPDPERPSEPLETWDMLSDVEHEVPPVSSVPELLPGSPGPSEPGIRLLSPYTRREGARSKHRSLLNHRLLPSPLPLTSTAQRYRAVSSPDVGPRGPIVPVHTQEQSLALAASATSLVSGGAHLPFAFREAANTPYA